MEKLCVNTLFQKQCDYTEDRAWTLGSGLILPSIGFLIYWLYELDKLLNLSECQCQIS